MRKSILLIFVLLMLSAAAVRAYNPYPVAIIHAPSNIYVGEQVEFDGSYSYDSFGPLIWYVWSVNGVQKQAGSDAAMFYHSFSLPPGFAEEQVQVELCVYNTFPYEDCTSVVRTVKQKPGHYYYLTDHLGSVRATVNATGQLVGWDDYYPFGGQMPGRSMNMANPNDLYKFTGHERDTEAGLMLDFMNARNYDPEMGRFLHVDPHASNYPGLSPYAYVANNPLIFVDPDGRDFFLHDETGAILWRNSTDETYTSRDGTVYANFGDSHQFEVDGFNFVMFQTGEEGNLSVHTIEMFENPTGQGVRNDEAGDGHFGASRAGGTREHAGLDILSTPGQDVVAPFSGETVTLRPSGGVGITTAAPTGAEVFVGYTYTTNNVGRSQVSRGAVVGTANNMTVNYNDPRMQNHVHVQVRVNGQLVNPAPFIFRRN